MAVLRVRVAAALPGNAKCGLVKKPDAFHLAISSKVADLLSYVISSPDKFTTDQLVEIMWAGVQVGAVGAGAFDQKFSKDVLHDFEHILTERLQKAVAAKDNKAIDDIVVAAVTFGFKDLLALAKDE